MKKKILGIVFIFIFAVGIIYKIELSRYNQTVRLIEQTNGSIESNNDLEKIKFIHDMTLRLLSKVFLHNLNDQKTS